jgi:MFS family permease
MASETPEAEQTGSHPSTTTELTPRLVGLSMGAGLVGTVVMVPTLVVVPVLLDVFQAKPLVEFANIGGFFGLTPAVLGPVMGYDPSLVIGAGMFALGGILFLPVQFLVVAAFLPPESPRALRGGTLAIIWWFGFVFAFWPGGGAAVVVPFVVLSIVSHLLYGLSLGYMIDRFGEIPQHRV